MFDIIDIVENIYEGVVETSYEKYILDQNPPILVTAGRWGLELCF